MLLRTFLTECSSLVVIQNHSNIDVQNAVPIQCPVGHGLSTVRLADDYTSASGEIMPAASQLNGAAVVCLTGLLQLAAFCFRTIKS